MKSTYKINGAVKQLTISIKKITRSYLSQYNKNTINQTPHIQVILAENNKTRAHWQNFRYPNDKTIIYKIKKGIQNHKNQSYNTYIEPLTTKN